MVVEFNIFKNKYVTFLQVKIKTKESIYCLREKSEKWGTNSIVLQASWIDK